ncbi:MAG: hypothetical protein AAF957_27135 [Planctomycetota bacterium]
MAFGFRKKRSAGRRRRPAPFKARVDDFWRWFAAHERRLFNELQDGSLDPAELGAKVDAVTPVLAWEMCPSPEEGREGFTVSAEGSPSVRLLVEALLDAAPPLEHWTLFGSKQPGEGMRSMRVGDRGEFAFADFRFAVDFDAESERLSIQVHHPRFSELGPEIRSQLTFLALEQALGEDLIDAWVGPVEDTPERTPDQKYGVQELRRQVRAALELNDLDPDLDLSTQWTGYSLPEQGDGDLEARADVLTGTSRTMGPIRGLFDADFDDELAGTGACFAYAMLPVDDLESGREVEQRAELEDRLGEALREDRVGDCFGGALGQQYVYVDLVLFDEAAAIERLRVALADSGIATRASLRFFASERRDEHIALLVD